MKNLITITLVALTFGIFAGSAQAQSTSNIIGETYCLRYYQETYDAADGMFLDAEWVVEAEEKHKSHLTVLQNFLVANVSQRQYKTHSVVRNTIEVVSNIYIAVKHYHQDGSVSFTPY